MEDARKLSDFIDLDLLQNIQDNCSKTMGLAVYHGGLQRHTHYQIQRLHISLHAGETGKGICRDV